MRYFGCMQSCRGLVVSLMCSGLLAAVPMSAADLSVGFYLRDPQVHFYRLTEEKLQGFDKAARRVWSVKPSDPIAKALSQKPTPGAPFSQLVQMLEATPFKAAVESSGITVRDWLSMELVLKGVQTGYKYYKQHGTYPDKLATMDNMRFYIEHKPEIDQMEVVWSKLRSKQFQDSLLPRPPAPKNN
jgi:hypothetical protein